MCAPAVCAGGTEHISENGFQLIHEKLDFPHMEDVWHQMRNCPPTPRYFFCQALKENKVAVLEVAVGVQTSWGNKVITNVRMHIALPPENPLPYAQA